MAIGPGATIVYQSRPSQQSVLWRTHNHVGCPRRRSAIDQRKAERDCWFMGCGYPDAWRGGGPEVGRERKMAATCRWTTDQLGIRSLVVPTGGRFFNLYGGEVGSSPGLESSALAGGALFLAGTREVFPIPVAMCTSGAMAGAPFAKWVLRVLI